MNAENYKSKRKGQPKRGRKVTKAKEPAKEPITTQKLREIYSTKIEWAIKRMPALKEK
jgi:hypothetical protein